MTHKFTDHFIKPGDKKGKPFLLRADMVASVAVASDPEFNAMIMTTLGFSMGTCNTVADIEQMLSEVSGCADDE